MKPFSIFFCRSNRFVNSTKYYPSEISPGFNVKGNFIRLSGALISNRGGKSLLFPPSLDRSISLRCSLNRWLPPLTTKVQKFHWEKYSVPCDSVKKWFKAWREGKSIAMGKPWTHNTPEKFENIFSSKSSEYLASLLSIKQWERELRPMSEQS